MKKIYNNIFSICNKKYYNTNNNIRGFIKHYPPSNKEWKDSAYTYNKNYLKFLPIKNNLIDKLFKSHFYITNLTNIARSKRMRNLIIKRSSKNIFISKPSIKHFNDKIIINLYAYNRQKEFLIRKLYFYKRKYNIFKKWLENPSLKEIRVDKKNRYNFKNIISKRNSFSIIRPIYIYGIKYKNELDYFRYKTLSSYKKFVYFNNVFMFMFFSKLLSKFNVKIFIPFIWNKNTLINNILNEKPELLLWYDNKLSRLNSIDEKSINKKFLNDITYKYKYSSNDLYLLNKMVYSFIEKKFIYPGIIEQSSLKASYLMFKKIYYNKFFYNYLKKTDKISYYLDYLLLNNLKFTKLLYNLKILITKIYDKKTELNVVNLKYPFLNSDIYAKVIVNRAKKKINFLKVLTSSMSLSEKPKQILYRERENFKLNENKSVFLYRSSRLNNLLSTNYNQDRLNHIMMKLYPYHLINKKLTSDKYIKNDSNKIIDILNTIKFKWVSGVRLEGAGRLTRRNTASRSLFKFLYKGSLKNKQFYIKNDKLRAMSTIILRNTIKSNSQHSFFKSKKRIGSFGIKSWISSY